MKQEEYIISGMSCAACSASVQRVVSRLDGVESCDVNLITGKMTVSYDEQKTGQADFTRVVEKAGFGIRPDTPEETEKPKAAGKKKGGFGGTVVSAVLSALLLYISMGQMLTDKLPVPPFMNISGDPYGFALTQLLFCIPVMFMAGAFSPTVFPCFCAATLIWIRL